MESSNRTFLPLVAFILMISTASALEFYVGNEDGWVANPSQKYNEWAGKLRFMINDVLVFKYIKEESVLLVHREDYDTCNLENPIMKLTGGYSDFQFDRSGPFFFAGSKPESCAKGQKMIVVVLADRKSSPPPPSPPPPSAASPVPSPVTKSPNSSPSPCPSPSPSLSTKPPTSSPSSLPTPPPTTPPPPPGSQIPPYDVPKCPPVVDDGHYPPSPPPMDQAPSAPSPLPLPSKPPTPSPSPPKQASRSPIAAPAPSPSSASFTTVSYLSLAMLITMFFV